jgi:putative acetyltransferase
VRQGDISIRESDADDFDRVLDVEKRAFGNDKEAQLVADLLGDPTAKPTLSLLAFQDDKAVGHILFTRAYINDRAEQPLFHILAPLAVVPENQKRGVGGLLIREGLRRLKEMGSKMVLVLGHMDYYPKFGFLPDAGKRGYSAPYPIPQEFSDAWMVQSLIPEGFQIDEGKVLCAVELSKPEYWRE